MTDQKEQIARMSLSLPRDLHHQVKMAARKDHRSANTFILLILERWAEEMKGNPRPRAEFNFLHKEQKGGENRGGKGG